MGFISNDERGNVVTHAIGTALAVSGLVILINMAIESSPYIFISFLVYGVCLVLLYSVSTSYHSISNPSLKLLFQKFDHMAIYIFIAATYTPFCVVALEGNWRWIILFLIWSVAIAGVVLKAFTTGKKPVLSTILYITMGWLIIGVIKTLFENIPLHSFIFLMAGGLFYTFGCLFYISKKLRYNHEIWHIFVMAGSLFHYFSILSLI